jgi:hypothetical protein
MTMKKILPLCLIPLLLLSEEPSPINHPFIPTQNMEDIVVNNRILATIQGQTISVLDVMKKMDVFLMQNYPEAMNSITAKYQFYASNWREVLKQMVDNELIMIDAESIELKISDGDLRETLQQRFGPNIMTTLDAIGISYEEARELTKRDLIAQRMHWFRVNSKALMSVNPKDVKEAYREFCQKHPPIEEWNYRVITIRNATNDIGATLANRVYELVREAKIDLDGLAERIKEKCADHPEVIISVSKDFKVAENNMSDAHREVLTKMTPGSVSLPISQVSRIDNSVVHRIFYLKERVKNLTPSFYEISNNIQDDLLQTAISSKMAIYLDRLYKRLGYDDEKLYASIPKDFEPFVLF